VTPARGRVRRSYVDVSNERPTSVSRRFGRQSAAPDRGRAAVTVAAACAYFETPEDSLEQAQERKLDLICRKLMLGPRQRLLDVGCGWGSSAGRS
jgi:hypothetical protein